MNETSKSVTRVLVYVIAGVTYNARFTDHGNRVSVQTLEVGNPQFDVNVPSMNFSNREDARNYWRKLVSTYKAFRAPASVESFFNN